jgi:hypothetical protein
MKPEFAAVLAGAVTVSLTLDAHPKFGIAPRTVLRAVSIGKAVDAAAGLFVAAKDGQAAVSLALARNGYPGVLRHRRRRIGTAIGSRR